MKPIALTFCIFILCACHKQTVHLSGLWKIRKVEVLRNNQVQKILDSGCQYWNFTDVSCIKIFDTTKIQNTLSISIGRNSIKSYDTTTGSLKDEFRIEEANAKNLMLSSEQQIKNAVYHVNYYLDRVEGTHPELMNISLKK